MKKTLRNICLVAIALFALPQQADAQFFKKLKKAAAEVVNETLFGEGTTETTNSNAAKAAPSAEYVTTESGVMVGNPAREHFDLEFIEAVGNAAANTVTIYVRATAKKLNYSSARVGGSSKNRAYDADGNEYKATADYSNGKNMMVGVPVKYELAKFTRVPATVSGFVMVNAGWYLDPSTYCTEGTGFANECIKLKNVPIKWQ